MNELLYQMIFKRRSFHTFPGGEKLTAEEAGEIEEHILTLRPLREDIRTAFRLVPREQTTCKVGEYCVLIYSEEKEGWLENAGYLGQQLDLWLASRNVGACWFGMAKPDIQEYQGLSFAIMLTVAKAEPGQFRQDLAGAKRKPVSQLWQGEEWPQVAEVARYAPSAVNTQPWLVRKDGPELRVYRLRTKLSLVPLTKVAYYNHIDMGIFLLILELVLDHEKAGFQRELPPIEEGKKENLTAIYRI